MLPRLQFTRSRAESPDVLGEAASSEAKAGVEELPADAFVDPDRVRERADVGSGGVAHVRHRVDEGDLGGEEGVCCDLDELRRGEVGHEEGGSAFDDGSVDPPNELLDAARTARIDTENDSVRGQGVTHREPLSQELRVEPHLGVLGVRCELHQP